MHVRLVAPMRESGTNQWRVTVGFCSCVSAILMGFSELVVSDYCIGFAKRQQTAVEDAVFLLTRRLHSSTAATTHCPVVANHRGTMGGLVHVLDHVKMMICKAAPVPVRAPSVTVVSRHQPGASEWLAQNPFLIPRISKVSALKKTAFTLLADLLT